MATAAVALAPILWSVTKVLITSITTLIANEAIKNCLNKTVEEIDKHHDWSDQQKFNALKEKLENIDELKENIDKIEGLDKDVSEKLKSLLNDKWCDCLSKFDASNVSNDNLQKLYVLAVSKFKPSNMNDTHILGMYDCELNKVIQNVDNRMENLHIQVHNNNNMNTLLNQDNDNNRIAEIYDNVNVELIEQPNLLSNQSVSCQIINEFEIYNLQVDSERSLLYNLDPNGLKAFAILENTLQPLYWNIGQFRDIKSMSWFTVNGELHFVLGPTHGTNIYRFQRFAKSLVFVDSCEEKMGRNYWCVTAGKDGKIYAPVKENNNTSPKIAIFDFNGKLYDHIPFSFNSISHIAIDDINENLIIVDQNNSCFLKVFSLKEAKVITTIDIGWLNDCCVDQRNGNIIVSNGECIKIFSYLGEEIKIIKRELTLKEAGPDDTIFWQMVG